MSESEGVPSSEMKPSTGGQSMPTPSNCDVRWSDSIYLAMILSCACGCSSFLLSIICKAGVNEEHIAVAEIALRRRYCKSMDHQTLREKVTFDGAV
jgi:hypothetical protein